jgi:hypothetical protein
MAKPVIAAALDLAGILDRENIALKAMDLRQTAGLLAEKAAAIIDLLASGEAALPSPHPALADVARRVDNLALENRRLLERAIVAQQRVIGIVVRAVAAVAGEPGYGPKCGPETAARPMALSTRA